MKQRGIIISLLLVTRVATAEPIWVIRDLTNTAILAVQQYFHTSGRVVDTVKVEEINRLNNSNLDYLVETGARAQSANGQRMINYHCGVFLKKVNSVWVNQHTECGPLDYQAEYRSKR